MLSLEELGYKEKKLEALEKKDIHSTVDLLSFYPRQYYDFSQTVSLSKEFHKKHIAIIGKLKKVELTEKPHPQIPNQKLFIIKASVIQGDKYLNIVWFGQYYLYKQIQYWKDKDVIVGGELEYNETYNNFSMNSPFLISRDILGNTRVHTVYSDIKGISDEFISKTVRMALDSYDIPDYLEECMRNKLGLITQKEAYAYMHFPKDEENLKQAQKRLIFDELLYFATQLEKNTLDMPVGSSYGIKSLANTSKYISSLPYSLTGAQKNVLGEIKKQLLDGKRINALVQGDVGCGKTTVAFACMMMMADSGYQSVLMAPTLVLAKQHYEELNKIASELGYKVAFLAGKQKAKEKRELLEGIKNGTYQFIVGTHSVITAEYNNLAMVVEDEEHKFGVLQREALVKSGQNGIHTVTMSATPIPRSLAMTIYSRNTSIFTIDELPANRLPVKTVIRNDDASVFRGLHMELNHGRQAYVVCSLIEHSENTNLMQNVMSVKQIEAIYRNEFPDNTIAVITGRTSKEDMEKTLDEFTKGDIDILISTSVIEVGVNVPNASVIVINNAERFGLSQLHQLRGRVGRGKYQSYCILKSDNAEDNARLEAMVRTNNGFEIAEADLQNRGAGDIIGTKQTGNDKYVEMALKYPKMFESIKKIAGNMVLDGSYMKLWEQRNQFSEKVEE